MLKRAQCLLKNELAMKQQSDITLLGDRDTVNYIETMAIGTRGDGPLLSRLTGNARRMFPAERVLIHRLINGGGGEGLPE